MTNQDTSELTPVDELADQTLFAAQEPVLEPIGVKQTRMGLWPKFRTLPLLIQLVIGLMLILVVMLVFVAGWRSFQPSADMPVQPVPTALPAYPSTVLNQYEQELATVEATIAEADPARDSLPFPPVDLELLLD